MAEVLGCPNESRQDLSSIVRGCDSTVMFRLLPLLISLPHPVTATCKLAVTCLVPYQWVCQIFPWVFLKAKRRGSSKTLVKLTGCQTTSCLELAPDLSWGGLKLVSFAFYQKLMWWWWKWKWKGTWCSSPGFKSWLSLISRSCGTQWGWSLPHDSRRVSPTLCDVRLLVLFFFSSF